VYAKALQFYIQTPHAGEEVEKMMSIFFRSLSLLRKSKPFELAPLLK
jgi:hypothetical protein